MTITLFIPCFMDALYPRAGISMVEILERLGHTVVCPEEMACCGQPPFNSGYRPEARAIATPVLKKLEDAEAVVIGSGSCGAMVKKFYPELFKETRHAELAKEVAARTWQFSDFLVCRLGVTDLGEKFPRRRPRSTTAATACANSASTNSRARCLQTSAIWNSSKSTRLSCCGFGGMFAAKFPMISTAMGEGEMRQRRRDWRGIHRLQRFELPDAHPRPAVAPGQADQNHQSRRSA